MIKIFKQKECNDLTTDLCAFQFKPFQRSREVGSYVEPSKVEQIVNPIDLVIIRNQTHTYRSFAAFQAEFDFFVHNCIILYTKQHAMTKAARAMIESVNDEIDSVKKCAECYINAIKHPDKWFTMPCSTPHLLLWARLKVFRSCLYLALIFR